MLLISFDHLITCLPQQLYSVPETKTFFTLISRFIHFLPISLFTPAPLSWLMGNIHCLGEEMLIMVPSNVATKFNPKESNRGSTGLWAPRLINYAVHSSSWFFLLLFLLYRYLISQRRKVLQGNIHCLGEVILLMLPPSVVPPPQVSHLLEEGGLPEEHPLSLRGNLDWTETPSSCSWSGDGHASKNLKSSP